MLVSLFTTTSALQVSPNVEWMNDCLQLLGMEHVDDFELVYSELTTILQRQPFLPHNTLHCTKQSLTLFNIASTRHLFAALYAMYSHRDADSVGLASEVQPALTRSESAPADVMADVSPAAAVAAQQQHHTAHAASQPLSSSAPNEDDCSASPTTAPGASHSEEADAADYDALFERINLALNSDVPNVSSSDSQQHEQRDWESISEHVVDALSSEPLSPAPEQYSAAQEEEDGQPASKRARSSSQPLLTSAQPQPRWIIQPPASQSSAGGVAAQLHRLRIEERNEQGAQRMRVRSDEASEAALQVARLAYQTDKEMDELRQCGLLI